MASSGIWTPICWTLVQLSAIWVEPSVLPSISIQLHNNSGSEGIRTQDQILDDPWEWMQEAVVKDFTSSEYTGASISLSVFCI